MCVRLACIVLNVRIMRKWKGKVNVFYTFAVKMPAPFLSKQHKKPETFFFLSWYLIFPTYTFDFWRNCLSSPKFNWMTESQVNTIFPYSRKHALFSLFADSRIHHHFFFISSWNIFSVKTCRKTNSTPVYYFCHSYFHDMTSFIYLFTTRLL